MGMGTNLELVKSLWSQWELRLLVLTSLSFQIILILVGSRRKHSASIWDTILLWSVYLLADAVATTTLGILARNQSDCDSAPKNYHDPPPLSNLSNQYAAFWSPFLLLHLGGPDNITAFSLQDNQLWIRHLLGLIFQLGIAANVFFRSLMCGSGSQLWIITTLMFLAGIIKYGERTWALMSASKRNVNSTISNPNSDIAEVREILHCHNLFLTYRHMFANGAPIQINSAAIALFHDTSLEASFKVIKMALNFMYEFLYTKASVVYTCLGCIIRFISFSSILSALILFLCVMNNDNKRGRLDIIDMVITYILLVGALVLEIYHVFLLIFSEWTLVCLDKLRLCRLQNKIFKVISLFRGPNEPQWFNSMAQYNLISICYDIYNKNPSLFKTIPKLLGVEEIFLKYRHTTHISISKEVKHLMFREIQDRTLDCRARADADVNRVRTDTEDNPLRTFDEIMKNLATERGRRSLTAGGFSLWSMFSDSVEGDFDKSIIIWYLVTYQCYYSGSDDGIEVTDIFLSTRQATIHLCNYMLYLLATFPLLSSPSKWFRRIRDFTTSSFEEMQIQTGESVETQFFNSLREGQFKSEFDFLNDAINIATEVELRLEYKWDIISGVWVEMLSYAAKKLGGNRHAQQLGVGGELITQIWLLEASFILDLCYQFSSSLSQSQVLV